MEKEILDKIPEWFHILRNALMEYTEQEKESERIQHAPESPE